MGLFYQSGRADEYLAITGAYVKSMKIRKSAFILPYQRVSLIV
jgi:hypothetical protein